MKRSLFFLFLIPNFIFAQKIFTLEIKSTSENEIISKVSYKKTFATKSELEKEIQNVLFVLYDNAYLTAEIENMITDENDSLHRKIVFINTGRQYKWATLRKGNTDEEILNKAGFKEKIYERKPFYYRDLRKLQEKILMHCENNGYPFASIQLDSVEISVGSSSSSGGQITASLNLQKNKLIRIDSVINRGSVKVSSAYLQSYLGIRNGDLYNESLVKRIGTRIKEIPFVKERIPFRVLFPGENAKVELFLEKKRASQFDGILGFLPDNKTGKILFTGDVRLKLHNSFNYGELLELNWRRLQASTQDLRTHFVLPFILKTPFGLDVNFKLYKKDTTYLEVNPNIGIQYHFSGENYFRTFLNRKQLSLLSTKGLENLTTLPQYADITSSLYGISTKLEKLDYRLNPRRGYSLLLTAGAGNKVIKKNPNLDAAIYDDIKLNTAQYHAELETDIFLPVKNRSAIRMGNKSAYLYNENLFQNELFRIGGLKSLRGFDEESILASVYSIFTLEYRFIFEENSYLFFFADGAYYENHSITFAGDRYDAPFGLGAGISFETKAGIFSLNYALGKQFNNPIDLKAGKVHFGIVNYF